MPKALEEQSARTAMEEALRRSNERFEAIARATRDLVYEWDVASGHITWNDVFHTRYGHPEGKASQTLSFWEAQLHPDDRERVLKDLAAALSSDTELWNCEYRFRKGDGGWAEVLDRGLFLRDAQGAATRMVGVMVDLTELHQAQAQLRMADRLASVGTLAAGVAHEINNPLSWVLNNLEVARAAAATSGGHAQARLIEALADAEDGARRVAAIVRDLKTFSRPEEDRRAAVSLERVIEGALALAHNELRHRARIVRDYAPVSTVEGNEARLGQVFLNLVVNAAQAMPEGEAARNEIRVSLRQLQDGRVEAAVQDTGPGIPEHIVAHIFDPFFTTKAPVGTGLGLTICHSIITSLGGELKVESVPDKGTTFRVLLSPAAAARAAAPCTLAPAQSAPARILIVDDEPLVGRALRRALERHDVVMAQSAREVLERVARGESWDLILCDLMMPDMSGMDFFDALQKVAPALCERMAFMTGGAFTPRAQRFFATVKNPRLEKPFDSSVVEAVLARLRS